MGQAFLAGADPAKALERVTPDDVVGLKPGMQRYGLLLNEQGTIKDDFMFTKLEGEADMYIVVNADTKDDDYAYIADKLKGARHGGAATRFDRALLALQGPMAGAMVLERLSPGIDKLTFMKVVRCGRRRLSLPRLSAAPATPGEDGFEISIEGKDGERVARALLAESDVMPIGLGARDSLRLEAGLCLYGHDIDETVTPVEANLVWSIAKRRKMDKDFPAAEKIMDQIFNGAAKKRVGILPVGKAPAREHTPVADKSGRIIGEITSGGFGPSLNAPVAMGYVETAFAGDGTEIDLIVRGKPMPARIAPMPFFPHRYRRAV